MERIPLRVSAWSGNEEQECCGDEVNGEGPSQGLPRYEGTLRSTEPQGPLQETLLRFDDQVRE